MIAYEVVGVSKRFSPTGAPVNDDITFSVAQGEFFGLLGSNGAGKTTLIKQMIGLLKSDSGSIRLFGHDVVAESRFVGTQVGYMPQTAFALNSLRVCEALYFTAYLRGLSSKQARRQRDLVIDRLDIGDCRNKVVRQMSGGERRLLQLAVAIIGDPPVLILDEPTNELDPVRRRQVWDLLRGLNHDGRTIILITHNALEAEQVIERVGIMRDGRMVGLGQPGELKRRLPRSLTLDITLRDGTPVDLPNYVVVQSRHRDRVTAQIELEDLPRLVAEVDLRELLEFRLQFKTLEDVYFDHVQ
ncbi:ABC transporter ATP-binding protein [Lentzea guizhouensis]|uniref:ABC transporter ATP-binding protein n=1 Tax=Lentzea guizhouensis TaxID=1586287 RepID=UPI000AB0F9C0|nr:ABC transporter ATP-binding protein [Lentzea guizhouensis]